MKAKYLWITAAAVILAGCGDKNDKSDATGVFESTEVVISAQTAGEIIRMEPEEGDCVEEGQELALTDTVQLSLKRREILAGMSAVNNRHYDKARQVAALRQQIATQQQERTRFARLAAEGAANRKTVDDIDARISLLEKQLDAQEETLENTNRSLTDEARSMEAQLAQLDDRMARAHVKSPLHGTILAKYAERGELAAEGKPLFKIADTDHLILRLYVTAPQLTELKLGQAVTVRTDCGEDGYRTYKGKITWIADRAEFTPKTIQTRDERANLVYAVKVSVKNDGLIKIGMYGECKF